ncbi:MAG TPA: hypothetical protein VF158_10820 [Longimicrobiales bacterium]
MSAAEMAVDYRQVAHLLAEEIARAGDGDRVVQLMDSMSADGSTPHRRACRAAADLVDAAVRRRGEPVDPRFTEPAAEELIAAERAMARQRAGAGA